MRFVENKLVEYKRELPDSLEKEAVAFLNGEEGGRIFIGIDVEHDTVVGVHDVDPVQLQIKDRLRNPWIPDSSKTTSPGGRAIPYGKSERPVRT